MSELMLVNPKRKRSRRRRKMTAKQLRYFGPRRKRRTRRRTALAAVPRRRHRRRSRTIAVANPRRRRRHSRRRHVTRLRRNPSFRMGGFSTRRFLNDTLIPAGIGAAGALGVDIALGYGSAYLPTQLQTGLPNAAVKIAAAVGIGMLAGAVGGKKVGEEAMAGAIVVTLYGIIKTQLMAAMPNLPLHGFSMGWVSPALQVGPMGAYVGSDHAYGTPSGLSAYVSGYETDSDYYRYAQ